MRSRLRYVPHLRLVAIIIVALLFTLAPARAVLGPALVFDAETGEVLIEERADEPWYPASITKLMTAYLVFEALEKGELQLDDLIPVSEAAARLPASKIGVPAGLNVKVHFALQSLLIHSANDMAVVLAEAVSGSEAAFVEEMNETARRLDMPGTHFVNPHGLHDDAQVTTARDMGLLAGAILARFPEAQEYFSATEFDAGGVTLRSRNGLLRQMPEADGMKTGFICDSGFNLVASATLDGRRLISVVLGAKSAPSRNVLSQVLLESAAVLAKEAGERTTLRELGSPPAGSGDPPGAPRSLNEMMCQGAGKVSLSPPAAPAAPRNWGVSLGRYPAPLTAEAILTGRMLASGEAVAGRPRGVVHNPASQSYVALVWNMSMADSIDLCIRLQRFDAPCRAMSPQSFADMARAAGGVADDPAEPAPPQSEGSQ